MIKKITGLFRKKSVEEAAAAWLVEKDAGLSARKEAEFERWCASDPAHAEAVARLQGTWDRLHELRGFIPEGSGVADPGEFPENGRGDRKRVLRRSVFAATGAIAALVVLTVGGMVWPFGANRPSPGELVYEASQESSKRVILEDGSIVELNAGSAVRARLSPTIREVKLVRGEAHFLVAKEPHRTFQVEAAGFVARALGTVFNVRLSADSVQVLVTEGRVEIESAEPVNGARGDPLSDRRTQVLVTGERAVASSRGGNAFLQIDHVQPEKIREAIDWQTSQLVFVDTPLGEALEQFNERNGTQVLLGDPGLAAMSIGGSFRSNHVEAFIRLLSSDGRIRVERSSPDRIVLHFESLEEN